jgi:hypothetical protein
MRILLPKTLAGGKFEGLEPAREEISAHLCRKSEAFTSELENGPMRAFLREDRTEESRTQITDCWYRAAEIFTQLQTQLASVYWSNVNQQNLVGQLFNERYVEAHRSQAFPPGSNEGKPIALVISPYVSFQGNEDGERYEKERVISKALVLVQDDPDLRMG